METCHVLRSVVSQNRRLIPKVGNLSLTLRDFCQQQVHFVILLVNEGITSLYLLELTSQLSHNFGQLIFSRFVFCNKGFDL